MAIVEAKVKPERARSGREAHRKRWWRFGETRPGLTAAIRGLDRVLVVPRLSKTAAFTFLPAGAVYSEQLVVMALQGYAAFALLQSRIHEFWWTVLLRSTMKDDPRYVPSDCFETFPFPPAWADDDTLERTGRAYYEFRAELMVRNCEGLTKTYHRFHSADDGHPDIQRLRELHHEMDVAVLEAYGWTSLRPACEFLLDHNEAGGDASASPRKKPWRFRWPDAMRDEVLARLLALNAARGARR